MANFAIQVENLSKRYHIGVLRDRHDTLRDHLVHGLKSMFARNGRDTEAERADLIWALKDVSFEIKPGEIVAFVGKNGAGKSTLLKVLSGITEPTTGKVTIVGRVGSLLEVGTGFHPELTGRENVYLSGAILGMGKDEIQRKFDEIVHFSEIEKFIDTPVKRYSSGMYVRLAFSVAAHLEPQILLTDEVLSVGDFAFQQKCLDKIKALTANGMTVLLVSHHMPTIQNACTYAFYLKGGSIVSRGMPVEVIENYRRDLNAAAEKPASLAGSGKVQVLGLEIFGSDGSPTRDIQFGDSVRIRIRLHCLQRIDNPMIGLCIARADGVIACCFSNWYDNVSLGFIEGDCALEGWLPPLRLIPDYYEAHVFVVPWAGGHLDGDVSRIAPYAQKKIGDFRVVGPALTVSDGVFQAPALKWRFECGDQKKDFREITPDSVRDALTPLP